MKKYLAAVSGGPDSMAMLDMYKKSISLVCHVNYQKRDSSNRDAEIVENYCTRNKIKFIELKVTPDIYDKYIKEYGKNFQNIARHIRYDFFLENAAKVKLHTLIVAHNKDDFLETALMQRRRGTVGLFLGIKEHSIYRTLKIYRPLLNEHKRNLEAYCKNNKIPYGIDETNMTDTYERNRIRKDISKWDDSVFQQQLDIIHNINKQNVVIDKLVANAYDKWETSNFSIATFKMINSKILPYVIYHYLNEQHVRKISTAKIELINKFIKSNKGDIQLRLGHGQYLSKKDKYIHILN